MFYCFRFFFLFPLKHELYKIKIQPLSKISSNNNNNNYNDYKAAEETNANSQTLETSTAENVSFRNEIRPSVRTRDWFAI